MWAGWGACWGSPGWLARAPGGFQLAASALGLGANKSVSVLFKSGVLVLYNTPINPTGFETSYGGSSSQCQTHGWVPNTGLTP